MQLFGIVLLVFTPNLRSAIFKNVNIYKIIFLSIFVFLIALFAQLRNTMGGDLYFVKECLSVLFYFFSAYAIVFAFKINKKDFSFVYVLDWLIIIFLIQAIVSFIFFFSTGLFDTYIGILKAETNQGLLDRTGLLNKRLIGVGSGFFSGVIKYGFALLILTVLPYLEGSIIYKNKTFYFIAYVIILITGVMTGRFFFVAIFLAIFSFILLQSKNPFVGIYKLIKIFAFSIPVFILVYFIAQYFMDGDRLDIILNFVFEVFINFIENGEVGTSSSDATISMYVFPDNLSTWLFGDGQMMMTDGSYYMGSDVGYVRLLFYFGIISTLIYFGIQFFYYKILKKLSPNKQIQLLFSMMLFWIVLLNFKGIANGDPFLVLFLVCLVYINKRDSYYVK
ncbi:O-antigen polymerase [Flavobacterium sp. LAR06]|uniref:O-antigen polymerase n=1 Tax=Flavobacterium sp. LAR06 TaxID=3064897 RepID=UPI0035BEC7E5